MRKTKRVMLLAFVIMISMMSCNTEELFVELVEEAEIVQEEVEEGGEEEVPNNEDAETEQDTSLPCEFTIEAIQSGDTVIVNCILDLQGQTINLPANLTIIYKGGDIINGTLLFSEGSIISGELLNSSLNIEGTMPQIKDAVFNLIPSRWGIVEGEVSDDIALNNKETLHYTFNLTHEMGVRVFEIGKMDAFFRVDINSRGRNWRDESIAIPSNFHLKMSDETYLRVQPNSEPDYNLLKIYLVDNVIVSGGHLIGDRFEHDYKYYPDWQDSHEWGILLYVIGSANIEIDNVIFSDPSGDAINFHGEGLRQDDGTLVPGKRETKNVMVKNCTILRARRNGISFLDGRDITIDNCIIKDTGNGEQSYDDSGDKIFSSAGTLPKTGIDMEAIRYRAADGSLRQTALNEDIIVRNSTFTGNEKGDVLVFTANDVIIENNFFDMSVGSFASHNVIVRNNIFESRTALKYSALSISSFVAFQHAEDTEGEELNHHWQFYNNIIRGYDKGIVVKGEDHEIKNNIIENCYRGVYLVSDLKNSTFSGNTISSNVTNSTGYRNISNVQNNNNVIITDEEINVHGKPLSINRFLQESILNTNQVTFKNCTLNSENPSNLNTIYNSKNITLDGNITNSDFEVIDSENIVLVNNTTN